MDDDLFISRREILAVLFRRRKGILAILVSALATAAFAVYYLISPSYEAEAVIMINSSYLTEPLRDGPPESDFEKLALFHTQRDVLKSERMAAEAVRRTNLAETRVIGRIERLQMFMGEIKRQAGFLLGIERWQKPWSPEGAAIAAVYDSVRTFALPDSKALKVTLRAKDPKEAAEVLSALLDAHRDYYFTVVRGKASGAVAFLEQEFLRSQGVLSEAEQALFQFKNRDRLPLDSAKEQNRTAREGPSIAGLTDSAKVQDEIKLYVLKLEEEMRVASLNPDNERRGRVVGDLKARIQRYLDSLNSIPARELEYVRLKRQFDIAQDNYQLIQRNLAKASLVASGETDKITLVELFQPPTQNDAAVFPQKQLILLLAGLLGIVVALTWAFVMDYLDHTIRSARDVERSLNTRLIASLGKIN